MNEIALQRAEFAAAIFKAFLVRVNTDRPIVFNNYEWNIAK